MPACHIYAIDFSAQAVELLRRHPAFKEEQITTAIADVTMPELHLGRCAPPLDFCLMIFVLSAVSPTKMPIVVRNLKQVLKQGTGRVLFRDYAVGDLAQIRFEQSRQKKKLGDNFYLRGDGTRCFYFTQAFLKSLFEQEGFICENMTIHERQTENRQTKITMHRKWIQAVFLKV